MEEKKLCKCTHCLCTQIKIYENSIPSKQLVTTENNLFDRLYDDDGSDPEDSKRNNVKFRAIKEVAKRRREQQDIEPS